MAFLGWTLYADAQIGYKPMNGYYQWNGNMRVNDSLFLDSTAFPYANGLFLTVDTTGLAATGYMRTILSSGGGTVKGTSTANYMTYWAASDSIAGSDDVQFSADSGTITLAPTGITALDISGASKRISMQGAHIQNGTNGLEIHPRAGRDLSLLFDDGVSEAFVINDNNLLEINGTSQADGDLIYISGSSDTLLYADATSDGKLGIGGAPTHRLSVSNDTGSEILLSLSGASVSAPAGNAGSLGSNFPTPADPAIFLIINVNGTDYYFPLWTTP